MTNDLDKLERDELARVRGLLNEEQKVRLERRCDLLREAGTYQVRHEIALAKVLSVDYSLRHQNADINAIHSRAEWEARSASANRTHEARSTSNEVVLTPPVAVETTTNIIPGTPLHLDGTPYIVGERLFPDMLTTTYRAREQPPQADEKNNENIAVSTNVFAEDLIMKLAVNVLVEEGDLIKKDAENCYNREFSSKDLENIAQVTSWLKARHNFLDQGTLTEDEDLVHHDYHAYEFVQQAIDLLDVDARREQVRENQAETSERQRLKDGRYDALSNGGQPPNSKPPSKDLSQAPLASTPTPTPTRSPADLLTANEILGRFGNPEHMARYENQKKKEEEKGNAISTPDTEAKISRGGGMANFVSAATKKAVEEKNSEWAAAHAQVFGRSR